MKLSYDFHLHSCLSPCGDNDMTPYNLVNMAKLLELDIIALTDHNSCANCAPAIAASKEAGITVVPGMELCTAEEIHVICLFPTLEKACDFSDYIYTTIPPIKNKSDVYGDQFVMDDGETILRSEPLLLVTACNVEISNLPTLCREYGGFCYPAHIDRASYSILSAFGMIDADMGFNCAEISKRGDLEILKAKHPALENMQIIYSSDAHRLEDMSEARATIDLPENSVAALIDYFINR